MASVVFTAVLLGIGRVAGAAVNLIEKLPRRERFELSEDGESLYLNNERYQFVGFSSDGSYVTVSGERALPGRKLGYVVNDREYCVHRLDTAFDRYVMLSGVGDCAEVYALRS